LVFAFLDVGVTHPLLFLPLSPPPFLRGATPLC
jgi:hypothetical protein